MWGQFVCDQETGADAGGVPECTVSAGRSVLRDAGEDAENIPAGFWPITSCNQPGYALVAARGGPPGADWDRGKAREVAGSPVIEAAAGTETGAVVVAIL